MKSIKNHKLFVFVFAIIFAITNLRAQSTADTALAYPFSGNQNRGVFMYDPPNIHNQVKYDITNNQYLIQNKIGGLDAEKGRVLGFQEYQQFKMQKSIANYWSDRSKERVGNQTSALGLPKLFIPGQAFDRIFGGNAVDIRPQGSAELIFGLKINKLDNPALPEEQRKTTSFDFQEKIQMNVIGKIGDKLKLTTSFNTESTFDFENQMKLEYTGYEDEIIKKLEVGNVSLPLNGTLITGSQSLFGFKTQLQFGRTTITGILSQQKSTTSEI